jgi:HlyD family secretion protein
MNATAVPPQLKAETPRAPDTATPVARKGMIAIAAFFGIFIVGGSILPLDAAVMGSGHVAVSGNRQAVQHRDGGVVAELSVKEGQEVTRGEILLRIDASELKAQESVLARQTIAARMLESRLEAQMRDARAFDRPKWMASLPEADKADAEATYAAQLKEFRAGTDTTSAELAVIDRRLGQTGAALPGIEAELVAVNEQLKLASDQLADIRKLYESGWAQLSRVRELESRVAELTGRRKTLEADLVRNGEAANELTETRRQTLASSKDETAKTLREIQTELLTLEPRLAEVRGQIDRSVVRATATGKVVGLSVFTVGGVVAPGQLLLEIVPKDAGLVIEAMVRPQDAQSVRVGQAAQVKFSIAHSRRMPQLNGKVTNVSADQLVNEASGMPYFKVEVLLTPEEMARATAAMGGLHIGPGIPAEIIVPTRGRTALGYLLDPIVDAFWAGMKEE